MAYAGKDVFRQKIPYYFTAKILCMVFFEVSRANKHLTLTSTSYNDFLKLSIYFKVLQRKL